jgi:hypothetical protein
MKRLSLKVERLRDLTPDETSRVFGGTVDQREAYTVTVPDQMPDVSDPPPCEGWSVVLEDDTPPVGRCNRKTG